MQYCINKQKAIINITFEDGSKEVVTSGNVPVNVSCSLVKTHNEITIVYDGESFHTHHPNQTGV